MMIIEMGVIAMVFFPGAYLLVKASLQFKDESIPKKFINRYTMIHLGWTRALIASGCLAFPGIRLTPSLKSWVSAELACLAIMFWVSFHSKALGSTLLMFSMALIVGLALLILSLKSESSKTISMFNQDLPLAAFLMSLLMESGMGSAAAMQETISALPPRGCAHELNEILRGRELGVSKRELFEVSRKRVPIDDYRAFLNLVEQGERLGTGLSQGLNDLSRRILEAQSHRAEILAQQAAVKMLLPLVLFIFPAVFLIVLSPVILNICSMAGW